MYNLNAKNPTKSDKEDKMVKNKTASCCHKY